MAMATPNPQAPTRACLPIYILSEMHGANARVLPSDCTGVGARRKCGCGARVRAQALCRQNRAQDALHAGVRLSFAAARPRCSARRSVPSTVADGPTARRRPSRQPPRPPPGQDPAHGLRPTLQVVLNRISASPIRIEAPAWTFADTTKPSGASTMTVDPCSNQPIS